MAKGPHPQEMGGQGNWQVGIRDPPVFPDIQAA